MLDLLKTPVLSIQEFHTLAGKAVKNVFRRPHYFDDVFLQMDIIGFGSLPIVILTGFFSGAVMALQLSKALSTYGAVGKTGEVVAISLVRELGPVLTSLMVAGRLLRTVSLGALRVWLSPVCSCTLGDAWPL